MPQRHPVHNFFMATVHVIGAGISGLAAATQLAADHVPVKLYEATASAGGRCRSVPHPELGTVDCGLHLIASGDSETFHYLDRISARDRLMHVDPAPLPQAPIADYAALAYGLLFPGDRPMAHFLAEENILYDAWATNFSRLHLHTPLHLASARAMRGALLNRQGGLYAAASSLAETFLNPALDFLDYCGGSIYFNHALSSLTHAAERITTLNFSRKKVALTPSDVIILATPASMARTLFPDITAPASTHSATTLHFVAEHGEPPGTVRFVHEGLCDLLRYDAGIIRVTVRIADHTWHVGQPHLAERVWHQLQALHPSLREQPLGHWTSVREKRAGHLMDMETTLLPKAPLQPHPQCVLAGDWVDPARPANLESAVHAGHRAADCARALIGAHPRRHQ